VVETVLERRGRPRRSCFALWQHAEGGRDL